VFKKRLMCILLTVAVMGALVPLLKMLITNVQGHEGGVWWNAAIGSAQVALIFWAIYFRLAKREWRDTFKSSRVLWLIAFEVGEFLNVIFFGNPAKIFNTIYTVVIIAVGVFFLRTEIVLRGRKYTAFSIITLIMSALVVWRIIAT